MSENKNAAPFVHRDYTLRNLMCDFHEDLLQATQYCHSDHMLCHSALDRMWRKYYDLRDAVERLNAQVIRLTEQCEQQNIPGTIPGQGNP